MSYLGFCPPGVILPYGGAVAPDGWLMCDGYAVNRTTYASLFAAIGTAWGNGDNSTTFNLPDMRGRFPRGKDAIPLGGGSKSTNDPDSATRVALIAGTFTLSCTTVLNSATVSTAATSKLAVGMTITGTGIPANSYIISIISSTQFSIGTNAEVAALATTSATNTMTFSASAAGGFVGSSQVNATKKNGLTVSGGTASLAGSVSGGTAYLTGTTTFSTLGSHNHNWWGGYANDTYNSGGGQKGVGGLGVASGGLGWAIPATFGDGWTNYAGGGTAAVGISSTGASNGSLSVINTAASIGAGDNETRPTNVNVNYIVKI